MAILFFHGCYSLETIPLNYAIKFPEKRNLILIHAGDSIWNIRDFRISDNRLTGHLIRDTAGIKNVKVSHVYAAPPDALFIEGEILTLPLGNIGKAEYYTVDWWGTISTSAFYVLLLFTFLPGF